MLGTVTTPVRCEGKETEPADDTGQVARLLPKFWARLHAFIRLRASPQLLARESSRDLAQTVCGEAMKSNGRARFESEAHFARWLCTIAIHKLVTRKRQLTSQKRCPAPGKELSAPEEVELAEAYGAFLSPLESAARRECVERLERAMAELPGDYLEVVTLAQIMQLPRREVGEIMGRSEVAVRQLLARALAQLGARLSRA